jgi:hypothetical protein
MVGKGREETGGREGKEGRKGREGKRREGEGKGREGRKWCPPFQSSAPRFPWAGYGPGRSKHSPYFSIGGAPQRSDEKMDGDTS